MPAYTEARERVSTVNAGFQENVAGVRVTQAFDRRERLRRRVRRAPPGLPATPGCGRSATSPPTSRSWSCSPRSRPRGARLSAPRGCTTGTLTAGGLIAFLLYLDTFFAPVQQLSQVFDGYQQAAVGLRRIRDLLRTPTSSAGRRDPVAVRR